MLKGITNEVDEDLLFELGTQFGEVIRVNIPANRLGGLGERGDVAFIEFATAEDAQYMAEVVNASAVPLKLHGRTVNVTWNGAENNRNRELADMLLDIGARLAVTGLHRKACDLEKIVEYFAQFGRLAVRPTIETDPDGPHADSVVVTVSFAEFRGSDAALAATDQKPLFGCSNVTVQYAMKANGEGRHGSEEERALYAQGGGAQGAAALHQQRLAEDAARAQRDRQAAQLVAARGGAAGEPAWAQGMNPFKNL